MPEGVIIEEAYNRSALIERSIEHLTEKIAEELIVVALVCLLFLLHVRSAFVAAITLPLAILLSFSAMRLFDVNANIMSLGGIAIAVGALIDASIVVVENCHKHLEMDAGKKPRLEIIRDASVEVGPSLFYSLMIITVSFLPVFILPGQSGRLFKPLAYTKTFSMASGAILAVTVIPFLSYIFIRGKITPESSNPINRFLIGLYRPVIKTVLKLKIPVLLLSVGILLLTYFPYSKIGNEFMPPLNEGDILYMPTTTPGISITEAKRVLQTQDRLFTKFPEVKTVFGKIGRAETATDPAPLSMVETTVSLLPEEDWPKRKFEDGYIEEIALDIIEAADDQDLIDLSNLESITPDEVATDVEGMLLTRIHPRMRLLVLQGILDDNLRNIVRFELPESLMKTIIETLSSHGVKAKGKEDGMLVIAEEVVSNLDEIPLRSTTFNELTSEEMEAEFKFPGMANAWTMPIKTRIDMLSTGIKTPIGIKIYGEDLKKIQALAIEIERVLNSEETKPEGLVSAIAERALGGNYLDFEINRHVIARYGLSIKNVQDVIQTAVGGMNVSSTVEGRFRFPINVRYPRAYRDDIPSLKRVLVPTPTGVQVPLGELAELKVKQGPPGIKSENGMLMSIVYVDISDIDVGTFVKNARQIIDDNIDAPDGTFIEWSGQFEYMQEANERLRLVIPLTIFLVFFLLYMNFRNLADSLIVMLSLPFSVVGGIWLMYLLDYNMSVAVGVGFIALAGVAAETGVVMIIYLNLAYKRSIGIAPMDAKRLYDTIIEGAANRVRPKIMTVMTTIIGLLPIMWATGSGSSAMKRIAAPMVGGMVSSTILTLVVIPVVYALVKTVLRQRDNRRAGWVI